MRERGISHSSSMRSIHAPPACTGRLCSGRTTLLQGSRARHVVHRISSASQAESSSRDSEGSAHQTRQQQDQPNTIAEQLQQPIQVVNQGQVPPASAPQAARPRPRPRPRLNGSVAQHQPQQSAAVPVQQSLQQQELLLVPASVATPTDPRPSAAAYDAGPSRGLLPAENAAGAAELTDSGVASSALEASVSMPASHRPASPSRPRPRRRTTVSASSASVISNSPAVDTAQGMLAAMPTQQQAAGVHQQQELNPIDGQPFLQPRLQPGMTAAAAPGAATSANAAVAAPGRAYASPAAARAAAKAARAAAAAAGPAVAASSSASAGITAPAPGSVVVPSTEPASSNGTSSGSGSNGASNGSSSNGASIGSSSNGASIGSSSDRTSVSTNAASVGGPISSPITSVEAANGKEPSSSVSPASLLAAAAASTGHSGSHNGRSHQDGLNRARQLMLSAMSNKRTWNDLLAEEIAAGELETALPIITIDEPVSSNIISSSSSSNSSTGSIPEVDINSSSSTNLKQQETQNAASTSPGDSISAASSTSSSSADSTINGIDTTTAASPQQSSSAVPAVGPAPYAAADSSNGNEASSNLPAAQQGSVSSRVSRPTPRRRSRSTTAATSDGSSAATPETALDTTGSDRSDTSSKEFTGSANAAGSAEAPMAVGDPAAAAAAAGDWASDATIKEASAATKHSSRSSTSSSSSTEVVIATEPRASTGTTAAAAAAAADSATDVLDDKVITAIKSNSTSSTSSSSSTEVTHVAEPKAASTAPAAGLIPAAAAAPAAVVKLTTPRTRRRVSSSSSSNSSDPSSASAIQQLLAGQRGLAAAQRRSVTGGKSSKQTATASAASAAGAAARPEVAHVNGKFVLVNFEEDQKALKALVPPLQDRLRSAVEAEQQYEEALITSLYAKNNLRRLQKDGLVLLGLQAVPHDVLYSSMVWKFTTGPASGRGNLPYHRFRQGDSLLITQDMGQDDVRPGNSSKGARPGAGSNGFKPLDATVLEVRKEHLLLTVDKSDSDKMQNIIAQFPAAALAGWRLDQSVRDTTARRQLEAINRLAHYRQPNSPFEHLLRSTIVGTPNGHYVATLPPMWVRDASWREDVKTLLSGIQNLNNSQRRAIAQAVVRSLTLWQGPPGTGKTRTLLALVEVLVKTALKQASRWRAMGPLLACADTNAAVDNLVEGLVGKGLRVVRLGNPAKVRASLRHLALEAQAEATSKGKRAAELREASKALFERAKQAAEGSNLAWASSSTGSIVTSSRFKRGASGSSSSRASAVPVSQLSSESLDADARRKWGQAEQLSREASKEVLAAAHVVCATCAGAGDPMLTEMHFNVVVIDEATQATEPATLVPLTQGAHCAVMAGDPRQLPPTIVSRQAYTFGLDKTLFDRLQKDVGLESLLLDTQYRMNPAISKFPSRHFYGGKLQDGVSADAKPAAAGVEWPVAGKPMMVVSINGLEEKAQKSGEKAKKQTGGAATADLTSEVGLEDASYRNLPEARVALQALHALMKAGDAATGAILTPYKGQVRSLEHGLRVLAPWFAGMEISVSSVDGYQGREADVIVFSAVRCNDDGKIGFVSDPRRLNVAITRPRRGLVVVCSPETLARGSPDWSRFMSFAEQQGYICGPQQLPLAPWQHERLDPFSRDAGAAAAAADGAVGGVGGSRRGTAAALLTSSDEEYTIE